MLLETETPTVRNIPLIVEGHGYCPSDNESTGFPFDSDRDDHFRSRLDDLAQRHPEFAEHLTDFPFRSNSWGRNRRGSSETDPAASASEGFPEYRRFADRPFGSRFDRFGFPFVRHFGDRPDFPGEHQQHPKEAQSQAPPPQQQQQQEVPKQQQDPAELHKPPQGPDRGRKVNPNLPQSNTVDLGQKQEPVNDNRSQRSMSAPPENRSGKRFVSSINIPINRDIGGDEMGAKQSQPEPQKQPEQQQQQQHQQQQKPNERVIPIHVEGRDEPVIPKNIHQTFKQQPQPQPQPQRVFGQKPSTFTQFVNKPSAPPKQPQQQQPQPPQQQQQQQTEPPETAPQPQPQKPQKQTPLDQIQLIQKDVLELMNQVEKFAGKPRDKQYLYLDEMLTRNLIKLDNVETEGKDNIRQARKEAIKCIEKCISILESKAAANAEKEKSGGEPMEVEAKGAEGEAKQEVEGEPMEVLQVGGVSRSGSQAKMEIVPPEKLEEMEVVPETEEKNDKGDETKADNSAVAATTTTQEQPAVMLPMEVANPEEKVPESTPATTENATTDNKTEESPQQKEETSQENNNNNNIEKKKGKKKDKNNK